MAYTPINTGIWVPEVAADASAWQSLIDNDAELYASAGALYASAFGPYISPSDGSNFTACYFALPGNYDRLTFKVAFSYMQSGSSASVKFTVTDGTLSDASASIAVTSSSGSDVATVIPSNTSASSTPRYGYLQIKASAGETITLLSIYVTLVPSSARSGVLASGYVSVDRSWYTSGAPIPSEIVETLQNNPHKIALDRLNALVSIVLPSEAADRGAFSTDSATFAEVTRLIVPLVNATKTYRIWCYVERSSTAKADVSIVLGSKFISMSDDFGIMQATFTASAFDLAAGGAAGNAVMLRVASGSGYVALRTLQVLEEPS